MPIIFTPGQFNKRAEFYHQLAQLTSAGIGVVPALEQIQRNPPASSFREPLHRSVGALTEGRSIAESLRVGAWLPDFDIVLIEAGEWSGRLDACLRQLADYYSERARIAKLIISQLIYPAFLIHFAVFIFLVILPFASPFGSSHFSDNPAWLLARAALILSPIYLATALLIYAGQSRHGENWRSFLEKLLRPVPLLGSGRHSLAVSRLAMALEALISAGVNIVDAWQIAAAASSSPALRRAIAAWKPQLAAGRTPAELVRASLLFPEAFANLYHSGEISGKLDETLQRLHVYYQEEGTHKIQLVAQWVPRLIYFVIVLCIAYFIFQFYTGYFNQINQLTNF